MKATLKTKLLTGFKPLRLYLEENCKCDMAKVLGIYRDTYAAVCNDGGTVGLYLYCVSYDISFS